MTEKSAEPTKPFWLEDKFQKDIFDHIRNISLSSLIMVIGFFLYNAETSFNSAIQYTGSFIFIITSIVLFAILSLGVWHKISGSQLKKNGMIIVVLGYSFFAVVAFNSLIQIYSKAN